MRLISKKRRVHAHLTCLMIRKNSSAKFKKKRINIILSLFSIDDGMVAIINNDENVILLNKSAERMIGIKMEDALGRRISTIIPNGMLPKGFKNKND